MKMKYIFLKSFCLVKVTFWLSITFIFNLPTYSYDFMKDDIYYNIISLDDLTLEVSNDNSHNSYKGSFSIPEKVDYMGKSFTVISIGDEAFMYVNNYGFMQHYTISLPSTITKIGERAFFSYPITSINLPNNLKYIGKEAFWNTEIPSVYIPATVEYIGEAAFSAIDQLETIIVDSQNKYYDSRDECNAIIETKSNTLIASSIKNIIPKGILHIGSHVFISRDIEKVDLPEGLVTIGEAAFSNCKMTSITIPNSVNTIGMKCFSGCKNLKQIELPEKIKDIPEEAFAGCDNLTSITLPVSTEKLGNNALRGCKKLESISLPESLEIIEDYVFYNCASLSKIIFPRNLKSAGKETFGECNNLANIFVCSETPFEIQEDCFPEFCYTLSVLTVPTGSKKIYSRKRVWRKFKDIRESDNLPSSIVNVHEKNQNQYIYDINGRKLNDLQRGINIINGRKIMIK